MTAAAATVSQRTNVVFQGTNVSSGTARVLVVATASATEIGGLATSLDRPAPETGFDRGLRHFGGLLTSVMLAMVLVVFAAHMFRGRPPAETLLFSIALAVGLSPELLPAVLSVSLARGAQAMAARGVLVRRLHAIENLGGMSVLCTDKTGTLTEGVRPGGRRLRPGRRAIARGARGRGPQRRARDRRGESPGRRDRDRVPDRREWLAQAWGSALRLHPPPRDGGGRGRRRHSPRDQGRLRVGARGVQPPPPDDHRGATSGQADRLRALYEGWTAEGLRVLAVATRRVESRASYGRDDEQAMTFLGFVTFFDKPKDGAREAVQDLARLGVCVKMVTGDSRLVARHVAQAVGIPDERVLTGRDLDALTDDALAARVDETDLYAEVDPRQKARLIAALRARGHVVGFLGDGINDAPAMRAADTSLSVDSAVDVAREAADFVLLDRSLDVIRRGVEEGRRTFANTMKYILMTTSANLGNMASMAVASLVLPFLPLTASQILLNNLLSDIPAIGIAGDRVDPELVERPERWDMRFIGRYMLSFGALSSAFDLLTFAVLLRLAPGAPALFRTGWFVESLLTELLVALVVRTRRPFYRSRPGRFLLASTIALVGVALLLPSLPGVSALGFVPLPPVDARGDCRHHARVCRRDGDPETLVLSRRRVSGTGRLSTAGPPLLTRGARGPSLRGCG